MRVKETKRERKSRVHFRAYAYVCIHRTTRTCASIYAFIIAREKKRERTSEEKRERGWGETRHGRCIRPGDFTRNTPLYLSLGLSPSLSFSFGRSRPISSHSLLFRLTPSLAYNLKPSASSCRVARRSAVRSPRLTRVPNVRGAVPAVAAGVSELKEFLTTCHLWVSCVGFPRTFTRRVNAAAASTDFCRTWHRAAV